jgi:hypothetical protein
MTGKNRSSKQERRNIRELRQAYSFIGYVPCNKRPFSRKPELYNNYLFLMKDGSVVFGFHGEDVSLSVETGRAFNFNEVIAFLPKGETL